MFGGLEGGALADLVVPAELWRHMEEFGPLLTLTLPFENAAADSLHLVSTPPEPTRTFASKVSECVLQTGICGASLVHYDNQIDAWLLSASHQTCAGTAKTTKSTSPSTPNTHRHN